MIIPIKQKILVQKDERKTSTETGILLPKGKNNEITGTIIAAGPEADSQLKVGMRVLFGKHDGIEIEDKYCNGLNDCILLSDSHIKGVFSA